MKTDSLRMLFIATSRELSLEDDLLGATNDVIKSDAMVIIAKSNKSCSVVYILFVCKQITKVLK